LSIERRIAVFYESYHINERYEPPALRFSLNFTVELAFAGLKKGLGNEI
jgi:hypothetical protein